MITEPGIISIVRFLVTWEAVQPASQYVLTRRRLEAADRDQRSVRHGVPDLSSIPPLSLAIIRSRRLRLSPPRCLVTVLWRIWRTCLDARSCRFRSHRSRRNRSCLAEGSPRRGQDRSRARNMAVWIPKASGCNDGVRGVLRPMLECD
jgi:hypothetical protein